MSVPEIYIKLIVGFPRDPKVRRLIQYGAEAGLCRDLYVAMVLYCKENLSDGYVPAEEVGVLAYPLPVDHANQLAKQLASVELITEVSNGEQQGWLVNAYLKRNGSKKDVERLSRVRAEAGRKGGRPPRETAAQKPAQATRNQIGKQVAKQTESRPNPYTETESKTSPLPPTQHPLMFAVDNVKPGEGEESQQDDQARDVAALVAEIRAIRDDWSTDSVVRTLNDPSVLERPWPLVRSAALIVARDSSSALFGRLKHDGPWWQEARVQLGQEATPKPPWCRECDERTRMTGEDTPRRCPNCHPLRRAS
jgi:hypothetical protein